MTATFFKKMFWPSSLRYQLLTRTLFIVAFILLVIGAMQYVAMKNFLYSNEAETLKAKMMSLPHEFDLDDSLSPDLPDRDAGLDENRHKDRGKFFFLQEISLASIDYNGNYQDLLKDSSMEAPRLSKEEYNEIAGTIQEHRDSDYKVVKNAKGMEQLIVFRPYGGNPDDFTNTNDTSGLLQIGINAAPLHKVLFRQLLIFIILSAAALIAGLALYFRILDKTLVPLSKIVAAVKNINAGNLADRLPSHQGQEEIDRLSITFNGMLERLEASFEHEKETKEQMRRFIADASHELRTPLTSINGFVEVLLRGAANRPEQLYKALNSMHGEARRIIKLVEDLLLLTKLDQAPVLQLTDTDLSLLIRDMEPQLTVLAGNRHVQFDLTEGVHGNYEADKIKQVILNLFNNAVQHTDPEAGNIKISLMVNKYNAVLSIEDNGPGISTEGLSHIFDRFYRVDTSRTRQYGGAGLGLAITKSIVEAHGGRIEAESEPGHGSTFIVYLPSR